MKKRVVIGILFCAMMAALTACGNDSGEGIPTATPTPEMYRVCGGEVVLGQYKELVHKQKSTKVTQEELDKTVENLLKQYPNYVKNEARQGTAVKDGDFINIDYTGYMDDKAFENGSDKDFVLEIGSKTFIDGFESGLIGKTVGETVDVNVTFPDPYKNNPDLAGKPAVFKVTINYVCDSLDHMTDDYVKGYTDDECETVDEFLELLEEDMENTKKESLESEMWTDLVKQVVENCEYKKIDQADVDFYYNQSIEEMKYMAEMYGVTVEQLVTGYGGYETMDSYYEDQKASAEKAVKQYMALQKIAETEKITVSDEVYKEYVKTYMSQAGINDQTTFEATYSKDYIEYCMLNDLVLEFVRDNATIVPAEDGASEDEKAEDSESGDKTTEEE